MEPVKSKGKVKRILIALLVILLIVSSIITIKQSIDKEVITNPNSELLRSMSYEQFVDGDENVEGTDNVKFSAFFLRDLDDDGYAEKLKGTCKEIGKQDTLYMEINVLTEGKLTNGKITINGQNFYLNTTLPKDDELKNNYIGNDIRTIEFNDMLNGTQKMIIGVVKSGDYTSQSSMTAAIGNNVNNYSRANNIVLTGTYIDEEENEIEITKTIPLTIDWYGRTQASIYTTNQNYNDLESKINNEEQKVSLGFTINTEETKKELNIYSNHVEGEIPQLNGYDPINVICASNNVDFSYDEESRIFVIDRDALTDTTGYITRGVARNNTYNMQVVYPLEAYESLDSESIRIEIPVSTYYKGYNNSNSEFTCPYKSNIAKATIIVYTQYKPIVEPIEPGAPVVKPAKISITVGDYLTNPNNRYVVSKRKPLKIYNEISTEEKDDTYKVRWYVYTGTNGQSSGIVLKEGNISEEEVKHDDFIKTDASYDSMENLSTTIGISFSEMGGLIKDDGEIKVYDEETNRLLVSLTKTEAQQYTSSNPYKFETPVKHVRVETSETNADTSMYVYLIKELDDDYIVTHYTREEFDELQYIQSNLEGYIGEDKIGATFNNAKYEEPFSIATISISNNKISTQMTEENEIITINALEKLNNNQAGWTNGTFLVKFPEEIVDVVINEVLIDNAQVKINSYELIEKENTKYIKINTENKTESMQSYQIKINCDISPDSRIATITRNIELYATNEEVEDYYYNDIDIYDVNDNLNTAEKVNKTSCSLLMISPNSLLISQVASEYDENGTVKISPQIADIRPQYAVLDESTTAKIGVNLKNNYANDISEVKLIGIIPFEGNKYVISNRDMSSTFTTKMLNEGITIPTELEGLVTVYYSENEHPTKELESSNGWKTSEEVENWDSIKTFMIDFEDYKIAPGKVLDFNYTIEIPGGLDFNKLSYSEAGVYFSLHTDEGKYRTKTEPNKLGFKIAEKYKLDLIKYQTGKDTLVSGATYLIKKEGDEEGKTGLTDQNGKLCIQNLYSEEVYTVQEIKSPEDYELNSDTISFVGHVNREDGALTIEKLDGTIKGEIVVTKVDGEYKATIQVEDEAKARLKIIKEDEENQSPIRGVRYTIKGKGLPVSGRIISTNTSGEANLKGLIIGEEYTIEETKAEGYYLIQSFTIKLINEGGAYIVKHKIGDSYDGDEDEINKHLSNHKIKNIQVIEQDSVPTININLEDEPIPTYNIQIKKIEAGTENTLQGAKFKLYKENKELGTYETDENGLITVSDLYQYEEIYNMEQTYVLKEVFAPEGYAKTQDIEFYVKMDEEEIDVTDEISGEVTPKVIQKLKLIETNGGNHTYTVENDTVTLVVEDNPSFKLIKKDGETNALLPNTKFSIYNVDEGEVPARDSKNEIIGTKETINSVEYYTVTTDENGEIRADLPEGLYKAVEVEANDDKYELDEWYFGIGASSEGENDFEAEFIKHIKGISVKSCDKTEDDGYVIVANRTNEELIDFGDGVIVNGFNGTDGVIAKYSSEGHCQWAIRFGGDGEDKINAVVGMEDGGILIGGSYANNIVINDDITLQKHGNKNGMIIKYDMNGNCEWAESVGDTSRDDEINCLIKTVDGSVLAVGRYAYSKTILLKIDLNHIISDDFYINPEHWNNFTERCDVQWMSATSDGGFIISQYVTHSPNGGGPVGYITEVTKYDNSFGVEWKKSNPFNSNVKPKGIVETSDGGYLTISNSNANSTISLANNIQIPRINGTYSTVVIKYDSQLNPENAYLINIANAEDIIPIDGGFLVCGGFNSKTISFKDKIIYETDELSGTNGMLMKINEKKAGIPTLRTVQSIGGELINNIKTIAKLSDGGFIIGCSLKGTSININDSYTVDGSSQYASGIIVKYGEAGEQQWFKNYGVYNSVYKVISTQDSGYIVAVRWY